MKLKKIYWRELLLILLVLQVNCLDVFGQDLKKLKKEELVELVSRLSKKSDSLSVEINNEIKRFRDSEIQIVELRNNLKSTENKLTLTSEVLNLEKERFAVNFLEKTSTIEELHLIIGALNDSIVKIKSSLKAASGLRTPLNYGGSYTFGSDVDKGPVGDLDIYPVSEYELLFNLHVNRGTPTYADGQVSGKMTVNSGVGVYVEDECGLKLKFGQNSIQVFVDSAKGNCGTGHGVRLDGIYVLETNVVPTYFENMAGEKTYFEDLLIK